MSLPDYGETDNIMSKLNMSPPADPTQDELVREANRAIASLTNYQSEEYACSIAAVIQRLRDRIVELERPQQFCRACGAGMGKWRRAGEGTCQQCDPEGVIAALRAQLAERDQPPREPTQEMVDAGEDQFTCAPGTESRRSTPSAAQVWRAMYEAEIAALRNTVQANRRARRQAVSRAPDRNRNDEPKIKLDKFQKDG